MNQSDILELERKILYHKKRYYDGEPEISDIQYDNLEKTLKKLDPENPVLYLVGSPEGGKIEHIPRMLSSQKANSLEEIIKWKKEISSISAGYKVDGLSLSLIYENGKLIQAATRGNGQTGDDVTLQAMKIKNIPKNIDIFERVNVRGEVYMKISEFKRVNGNLDENEKYSSPRNLATGSLKQKNINMLDDRELNFMAWQLLGYGGNFSIDEQIKSLRNWGFEIADKDILVNPNTEELNSIFEKYVDERENLDFEIDGVIFKYLNFKDRDNAGETDHHPRWSIAWKFQSKGETTIIEDITWQVGRTGVLTPVAELRPIFIAGAKIQRATLHNLNFIETENIAIGDKVSIVRAGDVIPKVLKVIEKGKNLKPSFPNICPSCANETQKQAVELVCNADVCKDKNIQKIAYWIKIHDIKGLGLKSLQKLYDEEIVLNMEDLYDDKLSQEILVSYLGKNGVKIKNEIERSRYTDLSSFLTGLGIQNLGRSLGKQLSMKFKNLEAIKNSVLDDLIEIDGISELTANYILSGLNSSDQVEKLLENGVVISDKSLNIVKKNDKPIGLDAWFGEDFIVEIDEEQNVDPNYNEKRVYVTGTIQNLTKKQIKSKLEGRGIIWQDSITKNLDYLIFGEKAGNSKLSNAEKKGVKILSWTEFNDSLQEKIS